VKNTTKIAINILEGSVVTQNARDAVLENKASRTKSFGLGFDKKVWRISKLFC